jgi:hypothetical protein
MEPLLPNRHQLVSLAAVALLIATLLALPAGARDATSAERAALEERIRNHSAAMRAGDFATIVSVIPPRLLKHLANSAAVSPDVLKRGMVAQMQESFEKIELISFSMDLPTAKQGELADGTPYFVIPTTTMMDVRGADRRIRALAQTLALLDEGTWYLVSLDDPQQVAIFTAAFPAFKGIEIPPMSMQQEDKF